MARYTPKSCVALSSDKKVIVSGCYDGTVWRWDTEDGTSIGEMLHDHSSRVVDVALISDGSVVVSKCADNSIGMWVERASPGVGSADAWELRRSALESLRFLVPKMSSLAMRSDGGLVVIGLEKRVVICRWVE